MEVYRLVGILENAYVHAPRGPVEVRQAMRRGYEMYVNILLAVFLATTFVSNGMVTCWAIESRWHWFARSSIILAFLSPLLCADAIEPFAILLLQAATMAVVIFATRATQRGDETKSQKIDRVIPNGQAEDTSGQGRRGRFSLSSGLLMIGLVGIVLAILVRMPTLNSTAWQSMGLIGVCLGACASSGYWVPTPCKRRWATACLFLVVVSLAAPLAWCDWLVPSLVGLSGWPPDPMAALPMPFNDGEERPILLWFPVCLSVVGALKAWRFCGDQAIPKGSVGAHASGEKNVNRHSPRVIVFFVTALLPAYVVWLLVKPVPIPVAPKTKNVHDRIVQVAQSIARSEFNALPEEADESKREVALLAIADDLIRLRGLLREPSFVPVDYNSKDLDLVSVMDCRSAAAALCAQGQLIDRAGDRERAMAWFVDAVRIGVACRAEGLLMHALIGKACSAEGRLQLFAHREDLSPKRCAEIARELVTLGQQMESYSKFKERDRTWTHNAMGWHGRLQAFLFESTGSALVVSEETLQELFLGEQAVHRLLAIEFALRAYFLERERWPASLGELVPNYLSQIPADPFDAQSGPMHYRRHRNEYVLYSVGANRRDDGGEPIREGSLGFSQNGDILLRDYLTVSESNASAMDSDDD